MWCYLYIVLTPIGSPKGYQLYSYRVWNLYSIGSTSADIRWPHQNHTGKPHDLKVNFNCTKAILLKFWKEKKHVIDEVCFESAIDIEISYKAKLELKRKFCILPMELT